MSEKLYVVYYHMNNINFKRYIGITCQLPSQRWRNGKGYKRSPHFYNAIKKYGWGNFSHYILWHGISYKEACNIEMQLIKEWKTQDNKYGYNLSNGGESTTAGLVFSEEHIRRLSESHKGKHNSPDTEFKKGQRQLHCEKPVRCIETGDVYYCASDAMRKLQCSNHIGDVCNGKRNICGGYHWEWVV